MTDQTPAGNSEPGESLILIDEPAEHVRRISLNRPRKRSAISVHVQRWAADGCVRDLGTLDAATTTASGSGIIAADSSCTSSQRDPESSSTFYARRHTFTLDAAAISVSVDDQAPGSVRTYPVLSDSSNMVLGRAEGHYRYNDSRLDHLLLAAGTYTIEQFANVVWGPLAGSGGPAPAAEVRAGVGVAAGDRATAAGSDVGRDRVPSQLRQLATSAAERGRGR